MLTINDVKSNDYAYFDSLEPSATRSAVKGAMRYITSLANLSNTDISRWDLERTFQKDGKWVTDKSDINRILFTKREENPIAAIALSPDLQKLLAPAFETLFGGSIRTQKRTVQAIERNFESYNSQTLDYARRMIEEKEKLRLLELSAKTDNSKGVDEIRQILEKYPVELWRVEEKRISFVMKNDTLIRRRDLGNKINRTYNLGRFIFSISLETMTVSMSVYGVINRWNNRTATHPHANQEGSSVCWGGFSPDYAEAVKKISLIGVVDVICRWKETYNPGDALYGINNFNHHPEFTSYEDGDWLGDILKEKGENLFVYECCKAGLFVSAPLTYPSSYVLHMIKDLPEYKANRVATNTSYWSGFFWDFPKTGHQNKANAEEPVSPLTRQLEFHRKAETAEDDSTEMMEKIELDQTHFYDNYDFSEYSHGEHMGRGPNSGREFYYDDIDNEAVTYTEFINRRGCEPDNIPDDSEDW